jgi:hypothetical protein
MHWTVHVSPAAGPVAGHVCVRAPSARVPPLTTQFISRCGIQHPGAGPALRDTGPAPDRSI